MCLYQHSNVVADLLEQDEYVIAPLDVVFQVQATRALVWILGNDLAILWMVTQKRTRD